MCGRYKRRSDKQRIAEAFQVSVGLEELHLDPEDDIAPQSFQPVMPLNEDGERQIELMRWAFKLPDRLLFKARTLADSNYEEHVPMLSATAETISDVSKRVIAGVRDERDAIAIWPEVRLSHCSYSRALPSVCLLFLVAPPQ